MLRVVCSAALVAAAAANAPPAGGSDGEYQRLWLHYSVLSRGPEEWGEVRDLAGNRKYPTCSDGQAQSPINLSGVRTDSSLHPLVFDYKGFPAGVRMRNTGSTIEIMPKLGTVNTVVDNNLGGARYLLNRIELHSPSQHTVGGGHYDLEMHLVHDKEKVDDDEEVARPEHLVVALLFRVGRTHHSALTIFQHLPALPDAVANHEYYDDSLLKFDAREVERNDPFHFEALLQSPQYYTYSGSMPRPPCTESYKYVVMADVGQISQEQLNSVRTALSLEAEYQRALTEGLTADLYRNSGNVRPVQALNDRTVLGYAAAQSVTWTVEDDDDTAFILGVVGTSLSGAAIVLMVLLVCCTRRIHTSNATEPGS